MRWPALLALLACAGCANSPTPAATRTTSRSTGGGPTPAVAATDAAALAAYREFWDVYRLAADPMTPDHPRLPDVAAGAELETIARAFLRYRADGYVIRGDLQLDPVIESHRNPTTVTVRDCYLDGLSVVDADSGTVIESPKTVRTEVIATLELTDRWRVVHIPPGVDGCTPSTP